jgi:hypothetical protein
MEGDGVRRGIAMKNLQGKSIVKPKYRVFGGVFSTSVAVLLLACLIPISTRERFSIIGLVIIGWLLAGVLWTSRRFGKYVVLAWIGLGIAFGSAGGYVYWTDEPNRQLVANLKQLGADEVETRGFLSTTVHFVRFDSKATNEQVGEFIELEGLDELDWLLFKGTKLTDATARKLRRFSKLQFMSIEGAQLSKDTVNQLRRELPNCRIMVNGQFD